MTNEIEFLIIFIGLFACGFGVLFFMIMRSISSAKNSIAVLYEESESSAMLMRKQLKDGCIQIGSKLFNLVQMYKEGRIRQNIFLKTRFGRMPLIHLKYNSPFPIPFNENEKADYNPDELQELVDLQILKAIAGRSSTNMMMLIIAAAIGAVIAGLAVYALISSGTIQVQGAASAVQSAVKVVNGTGIKPVSPIFFLLGV